MAELYLLPNVLNEGDWQNVLPARVVEIIGKTSYYIVENIRTTRRFLKQIDSKINIDELTFYELNKHTDDSVISDYLKPLEQGEYMAVVSEAGCPGIADPGANVVKTAHQKGLKVVPVVGPSSILLAIMASGLNGQNFAFNGYLPIKPSERSRAILTLEKKAVAGNQTQVFIETPYRNNSLIADLLKVCSASTLLCIAANITGEKEFISTKQVGQWKKQVPDLHKQPAIFLLGI
jgi:16S rRNA (cytidine1402-2'-O)-methyltransferase